jgi:hypothetical protein
MRSIMADMATLVRRIERFVGRCLIDGEDPTALGLCRIVIVSILTLSLLFHVGSVAEYFSSDALLAGEFAREAFPSRWSLFFSIEDPNAVRAIFGIGVLAHLLWLVGLWTTPAAIVSWIVWVSMFGRHPLLYSLADELQMALCTLLVLTPSGRGLSLDARRRGEARPVPVWCRRMIQLQMAVVYGVTGLLKTGQTWHADGTALYYALSNPYNRHFDVPHVLAALQPWLLRPATWVVLAWEVSFGGFVALHWARGLLGRPRWFPDLRKLYLPFGIAMHLGIQAMLYVAWFSPLGIASYAAFLRPEEARWVVDWVRRR